MTKPEPVGRITGFEKEAGEYERVQINMDDIYGIVFERKENIVEDLDDLYEGQVVYDCGRNMLAANPHCKECKMKKFLLDNNTLHCPGCA